MLFDTNPWFIITMIFFPFVMILIWIPFFLGSCEVCHPQITISVFVYLMYHVNMPRFAYSVIDLNTCMLIIYVWGIVYGVLLVILFAVTNNPQQAIYLCRTWSSR